MLIVVADTPLLLALGDVGLWPAPARLVAPLAEDRPLTAPPVPPGPPVPGPVVAPPGPPGPGEAEAPRPLPAAPPVPCAPSEPAAAPPTVCTRVPQPAASQAARAMTN